MRALDCACGHRVEGSDDEVLARGVAEHARQAHPEMRLSDEQIRRMVAEQAYDK